MRKGKANPKKERETRREMNGKQQPAGTAGEKRTAISGNSTKLLQTKPKKNNSISHQKTIYDRRAGSEVLSANIQVCYSHF
jgi:hypothetical protein